MKAGRAGSNPDGIAKIEISTSQPLAFLLHDIGSSVFCLNTIVVGLDAVEQGHEKPDGLDISWNPSDRNIAARKSRKYVLESVLIKVSEALNQFLIALIKLPRFVEIRSKWSGSESVAEKILDVSNTLIGPQYLTSAVALLVHWRNRIVHRSSRATLNVDSKRILRENEQEILENYKRLSVDRLLAHFEEGRPSLKDISSLISMSINWARQINQAVYDSLTKDDLDVWLDHYDIKTALIKITAETKPEKLEPSIRRMFVSRAPMLTELYFQFYPSPSRT